MEIKAALAQRQDQQSKPTSAVHIVLSHAKASFLTSLGGRKVRGAAVSSIGVAMMLLHRDDLRRTL
jgi:hypothetical protein